MQERLLGLLSRLNPENKRQDPEALFPIKGGVILDVAAYLHRTPADQIVSSIQTKMRARKYRNVWQNIEYRANEQLNGFASAAESPTASAHAYLLGASVSLHTIDTAARHQGATLPPVSDLEAFNLPVFVNEIERAFSGADKESRYAQTLSDIITNELIGFPMQGLVHQYSEGKKHDYFIRLGTFEAFLPYRKIKRSKLTQT